MENGFDYHRHSFEIVKPLGSDEPSFLKNDDITIFDALTDEGSSTNSSDSESQLSSPLCDEVDIPNGDQPFLDEEISVIAGAVVLDAGDCTSVEAFVRSRIENLHEEGSFVVCNLSPVIHQLQVWRKELPMVEPFYAVKCNPDTAIIRLLAHMNCGFDCATMGEIDLVVNHLGEDHSLGPRGKTTHSIVYANPAKMDSHIQFAMDNDVRMTVFDGEDELLKIARLGGQKKFDLLLRLTTDDKASICQFSKKFGCPIGDARALLELAQSLGLHVAGVSFHVGSGCGDASAYTTALAHSRQVFDMAVSLGMPPMTIVDIGGGFPGDTGGYGGPGMPTFSELAATVREGIARFGIDLGRPLSSVRFIAEPGRYFVSASTSIATKVYARKGGNEQHQALYVDDGVYGSFNNVVYDHATPVPRKLCLSNDEEASVADGTCIPSAVFGPTCDGLDQMCSMEKTFLPRCEIGDWLLWENMGAYTHTASFIFNGYTHIPNKTYCLIN